MGLLTPLGPPILEFAGVPVPSQIGGTDRSDYMAEPLGRQVAFTARASY